ncbi:MAG: AI-2E family transporter [Caenibius sp.]
MDNEDGQPKVAARVSPARIADPKLRYEARRAMIWAAIFGGIALAVYLIQPILVIFGALVFACMIDGGARLLGRILPIGRGWRIALVLLSAAIFLAWLVQFAGQQIVQQAAMMPELLSTQFERLSRYLDSMGIALQFADLRGVADQMLQGMGVITSAVGGFLGAVANVVLIVVVGIYIAVEPRLYQRGVAWLIAEDQREEFHEVVSTMAFTMRRLLAGRLLGMFAEGVFTWALLALVGVPMAALLGLLTGLLAFIPNIGALISGALITLVGFSGGTEMGVYAFAIYLVVQNFDGYVLVPMIARRAVDLAPAVVIAAQLMMGVLFGILGMALADPLVAMAKVAMENRSRRMSRQQENISDGPPDLAQQES